MKLDTFTPISFVLTIRPGYRVLFSFRTPVAAEIDGQYYKTEGIDTGNINSPYTTRQITDWIRHDQAKPKLRGRRIKVETRPQKWFDDLGLEHIHKV